MKRGGGGTGACYTPSLPPSPRCLRLEPTCSRRSWSLTAARWTLCSWRRWKPTGGKSGEESEVLQIDTRLGQMFYGGIRSAL